MTATSAARSYSGGAGLCAARVDETHDVPFRDASGYAGALHRGDVQPVLSGDLPYERRRLGAEAVLE